ncbi:hypothetical protein V565_306310, partial [Rhizoctonia solani 123E]
SRAETKKKSLASKKKASTPRKSQVAAPAAPTKARGKSIAANTTTAGTSASTSNSAPTNARNRRLNVSPGPSSSVANSSDTEGGEPLNDGVSLAPIAPSGNNQQTNLFAFFKPKSDSQQISTSAKQAKTKASSRDEETESDSSDNDDEAWSHGINSEIAGLKSKPTNAPRASSSTAKASNPPLRESATAKSSGAKARPKARPPPGANNKAEEEDLFRRNTRAAKQELIDKTETTMAKG